MTEAVEALRRGKVDAVFDDEVTLRQYADDALALTQLPRLARSILRSRWRSAAAHCSMSSTARFANCGASIPRFRTRSTARRSRISGAKQDAKADEASACRIWIARSSVSASAASCASASIRAYRACAPVRALDTLRVTDASYEGLEPEIARRIAQLIFGDPECVEFVPVHGRAAFECDASSWLHAFFALRKGFADLRDAARHELVEPRDGRQAAGVSLSARVRRYARLRRARLLLGRAVVLAARAASAERGLGFPIRERAGLARRARNDPAAKRRASFPASRSS